MTYKNIDAVTLKDWLVRGEVMLVDVRETFEYEVGNIQNAYHLPLGAVSLSALPEFKDKKVVIYCRSGRRSAHACERLLAEGIEGDIYNLKGGMLAWAEMNATPETDKAASSSHPHPMPIEQQVRVVAGGMILTTTIIGHLVSPWFYGLVGVMGGALMVSGLTGICLLAQGLAKMPWNNRS